MKVCLVCWISSWNLFLSISIVVDFGSRLSLFASLLLLLRSAERRMPLVGLLMPWRPACLARYWKLMREALVDVLARLLEEAACS